MADTFADKFQIIYENKSEKDYWYSWEAGRRSDVVVKIGEIEYRFYAMTVWTLSDGWPGTSTGFPASILLVNEVTYEEIEKTIIAAYEAGIFEYLPGRKRIRCPFLERDDIDVKLNEYAKYGEEFEVETNEKRYLMTVQTKASFQRKIELDLFDNAFCYPEYPIAYVDNFTKEEIEKAMCRLDKWYVFDRLGPMLGPFHITYPDDSTEAESVWKAEGCCENVTVECEGKKYRLTAVTEEKLEREFEKAYAENGYFLPIPNMLIVSEVSKEIIYKDVEGLVWSKNILKMKPTDL